MEFHELGHHVHIKCGSNIDIVEIKFQNKRRPRIQIVKKLYQSFLRINKERNYISGLSLTQW